MAHGERAERRVREVWSRRGNISKSMATLNSYSKSLTHRAERREAKATCRNELEAENETRNDCSYPYE